MLYHGAAMGFEWYRDVKDLTPPTYITSPVSCAIALPLTCNELLVTPSDLVVTLPAQAPINHNLKDLRRTGHAHLLNCPTFGWRKRWIWSNVSCWRRRRLGCSIITHPFPAALLARLGGKWCMVFPSMGSTHHLMANACMSSLPL